MMTMHTPSHILRNVDPYPFVPRDPKTLDERCEEIFSIQTTGFSRRLRGVARAIGVSSMRVALGVSGGLDSTLALLATIRTFDLLEWDRRDIITPTMPGYGTTDRTERNATELCEILGTDFRKIPINDIVTLHLRDLGHEPCKKCAQCQNAQARERTQILMDLAFTVGTGDLSEIALGWCTYNGDQQSMYGLNAGIPKTLVRHVVNWVSQRKILGEEVSTVLRDILATPISPELEEAKDGKISQKTEDLIGPYELQDFTLFHVLRNGFTPSKIFALCQVANAYESGRGFPKTYSETEILKWMGVFYRRFAGNQFKRNAGPDGLRVGSVALSQRGDWRMPSDIDMRLWCAEVETLAA